MARWLCWLSHLHWKMTSNYTRPWLIARKRIQNIISDTFFRDGSYSQKWTILWLKWPDTDRAGPWGEGNRWFSQVKYARGNSQVGVIILALFLCVEELLNTLSHPLNLLQIGGDLLTRVMASSKHRFAFSHHQTYPNQVSIQWEKQQ